VTEARPERSNLETAALKFEGNLVPARHHSRAGIFVEIFGT
jgi:hypothetical protein